MSITFGSCLEHKKRVNTQFSPNPSEIPTSFMCQECDDNRVVLLMSEIMDPEIKILQNWPIENQDLLNELKDLISVP